MSNPNHISAADSERYRSFIVGASSSSSPPRWQDEALASTRDMLRGFERIMRDAGWRISDNVEDHRHEDLVKG